MKEENLCQAFSDAVLCKVEDIDTEDWENPQLCSDYVKDIYQYLRQLEVGAWEAGPSTQRGRETRSALEVSPPSQVLQSIRPRFLDGRDINGRMRAILVDWLVQVHSKFRLLQETLYMCVAIMDRFLQVSRLLGSGPWLTERCMTVPSGSHRGKTSKNRFMRS